MMPLCIIVLLIGFSAMAGQTQFTWSEAVSNRGPYTLAAMVSNTVVAVPTGETPIESDVATHRYRHHTRIYNFSGVTALAWSSAYQNEEDSGMQTALAFSSDRGFTWSAPLQALASQATFTNIYTNIGVRISYPRDFQFFNNTNYLVCAVDLIHTNGARIGAALVAVPIFTNQTIGAGILISTNAYEKINGKPDVLPEFSQTLHDSLMPRTKVFGRFGGNNPYDPVDTEWTDWYINGSGIFCHPSTFAADNTGTNFYRFWRVNGDYNIGEEIDVQLVAQQYSTNSGLTWNQLTSTTIPSDPAVTVGVRLTDGRFAVIGNPAPYSYNFRDPLYLAITAPNSTAITNVWAIRQGLNNSDKIYSGYGKTGAASYVDAVQLGNYIYVSYSIYKENIGFSRVLIPELEDNNNDLPRESFALGQVTANRVIVQ
jgi:hypothetical protein